MLNVATTSSPEIVKSDLDVTPAIFETFVYDGNQKIPAMKDETEIDDEMLEKLGIRKLDEGPNTDKEHEEVK